MTYTALNAKQLRTRGQGKYEKLAAEHALIDTELDTLAAQQAQNADMLLSVNISGDVIAGTHSQFVFPNPVVITDVYINCLGGGTVHSYSIETNSVEALEVVLNTDEKYTASTGNTITASATCSVVVSAVGATASTNSSVVIGYTVA